MLPFLGDSTTVVIGDYVLGPSTYREAFRLLRKFPGENEEFYRERLRDSGFPLYRVVEIVEPRFWRFRARIKVQRIKDGEVLIIYRKYTSCKEWFEFKEFIVWSREFISHMPALQAA